MLHPCVLSVDGAYCFIAETGLFERFEHGKCVLVGGTGGLVDKEVAVTVVEEEVGDALDV